MRLVRSGLILKRQVALDSLVSCTDILVRMQADLLVFNPFSQLFNERVVPPPAFPVCANLNAVACQGSRNLLAGELAPLIGIKELRRIVASQRLLARLVVGVGG